MYWKTPVASTTDGKKKKGTAGSRRDEGNKKVAWQEKEFSTVTLRNGVSIIWKLQI